MSRVQIGWMPDYIAEEVAAGGDVDGWDLDVLGLSEVKPGDTFTVNSSPVKHHYVPVFVEMDV